MITADCENEPIHAPGAIQPHGVLLCVNFPALQVQNASANCAQLVGLGPEALLSQSLSAFLSVDGAELLRAHLSQPELHDAAPLSLGLTAPNGRASSWTIYAHPTAGGCIIELEPEPAEIDAWQAPSILPQFLRDAVRAVQGCVSVHQLAEQAVRHVRLVTGFDRVMVYQFTEEWHGDVVAEARAEHMHSYLHHHFPASDIPPQARAVFLDNWLRMIPDTRYQPVPVLPATNLQTGAALDLGRSGLRSVSPVHLEYLDNMDVRATLTLPLIQQGRLWGLIACHHATPRLVGSDHRLAAVTIAQLVSSQLAVKEAMEDQHYRAQLEQMHAALLSHMAHEDNLVAGLVKFAPHMLGIAGASGAAAAIYYDEQWAVIGDTPSIAQIETLVDWLGSGPALKEVFCTNHLSKQFAPAAAYRDKASGLMAISIPKTRRNFILWFRPEVATSVLWAGEPAKRMVLDRGMWRFHPRFSFASWREEVVGVAAPWKKVEVDAVTALRNSILGLDLSRAFAKEQAARQFAERVSEEKQSMVHIVSHDIRNPLSVIKMSLQMMELGAQLRPEQLRELVARSQRSAVAIERLVTAILDAAAHEHGDSGSDGVGMAVAVDVCTAIEDAVELVRPLAERAAVRLQTVTPKVPLPVRFIPVRLDQVLGNLLSNALKFTPPGGIITLAAWAEGNEVRVSVCDTGPGLPPALVPRLFDRFVRGDHSTHGAGLGLAIVKDAVTTHGGRVWAGVAPGGGAAFHLSLPADGG